MRNAKGSVQISPLDIAILRQVLFSGFTSRTQLQECLVLRGFKVSKKTIDNRLRILIKHGFLQKVLAKLIGVEAYSLLRDGEEVLRRQGECFSSRGFHRSSKSFGLSKEDRPELRVVDHWLDINEVYLALSRKRKLLHWIPEIIIRTHADIGWCPYGKEYDAVITFTEFENLSLGVEYERTAKTKDRYMRIVSQIETDKTVDAVLYLTPSVRLRRILQDTFLNMRKPVYVADFADFKQSLLDAQVSASGMRNLRRPLKDFLQIVAGQKIARMKSAATKPATA